MDFASFPPEVNSARMYTGAGSAPLLVAAQAWDVLAAELHSTASSYQAVVAELTAGTWLGPASASMSAAAATFVAWLRATAAQAEETSAQASSAAAAYQSAFSATVAPQLVAANRSRLMTLIATDIFGRNTPAIAATEAQYAMMWAQDVAAMYGYAASSASATALTPFTPPQQTTNPVGVANQAAAAPTSGVAESTVQQVFSAVPSELQRAAAAAVPVNADSLGTLADLFTISFGITAALATFAVGVPSGVVGVIGLPVSIIGAETGIHTDEIISGWQGEEPFPGDAPAPVRPFPAPLLNLPEGTVPSVEAGLGEAGTVGALSVPAAWTVATPAVRAVAVTLPALPGTPSAAAVPAAADGVAGTLSEMALAGMAGRAVAATVGTGAARVAHRTRATARATTGAVSVDEADTGAKDTVPQENPRVVVTGVAAELREFTKLRDEGILSDEEYAEQKNLLLGR
ncbi:PPE family protein, SVP subgroup [Mycobacterium paragordonae]|uniref:PPE domain-containing protein n=1 Tax=Mycobacterium paragordonae TaxID=1389713 RepID=A0AAJ1S8G0_9MYCO|nr:PPE domain-containing protein [Mycobacterium paragordonae]MDP7739322.1 PPE domain-containing protein [Mycobacterium paragordonae]TDK94619.1 PPE domain-containing protein [Mycobacterium paragordonae]TDL04089.1 PPE domain-containing protein [Mycobacterium paragordonae]